MLLWAGRTRMCSWNERAPRPLCHMPGMTSLLKTTSRFFSFRFFQQRIWRFFFLWQLSVLEILELLWCKQTRLIPAPRSKEEAQLIFCLCSPLPLPHQSPYRWLLRGCKHFLPNKQPAESACLPPFFLPAVALGLGHQFQPQGYVISVHHSQQHGSQSSSTRTHTHTASLANHFSSREVLANKKWGKIKSEKSLQNLLILSCPCRGQPLPFHVPLPSREAYVRCLSGSQTNALKVTQISGTRTVKCISGWEGADVTILEFLILIWSMENLTFRQNEGKTNPQQGFESLHFRLFSF